MKLDSIFILSIILIFPFQEARLFKNPYSWYKYLLIVLKYHTLHAIKPFMDGFLGLPILHAHNYSVLRIGL